MRESRSVLPCSRVSSGTSSSMCSRTLRAAAASSSPRFDTASSDHAPNASRAELTAASTSPAVADATSENTWPSAGFMTGSGGPPLRCAEPWMKAPASAVGACVLMRR